MLHSSFVSTIIVRLSVFLIVVKINISIKMVRDWKKKENIKKKLPRKKRAIRMFGIEDQMLLEISVAY